MKIKKFHTTTILTNTVLVNDGSTDNSLDICYEFEKVDNRIIILDKKNEGSIAARRSGIDLAQGKYIMFVDADDWIAKNMIQRLHSESIATQADVTVCNMYKTLGTGIIKRRVKSEYFESDSLYEDEDIKEKLVTAYLWGHPFPPSLVAKLYKKEILTNCGKYLKNIRFLGEDLFLNMEILLKAKKVRVIKDNLYNYRVGGFTSKYMPFLFEDMLNAYLIQKEVINEYFQNNKDLHLEGSSIMLMNTFKTCLYNVYNGNLLDKDKVIKEYLNNEFLQEAFTNKGSSKIEPVSFVNAIKLKDVTFLRSFGEQLYYKSKPKKHLLNFIGKFM